MEEEGKGEAILERTIIFTIARMNPPTPGHLLLIKTLITEAIDRDVNEVFIILSKTMNNIDNPISCPQKINILGNADNTSKTMINSLKTKMISDQPDNAQKIRNVIVHVICVPESNTNKRKRDDEENLKTRASTPFSVLGEIIGPDSDIPNTNLLFIVGDDRADFLVNIKKYYSKMKKMKSIEGKTLAREGMKDLKEVSENCERLNEFDMSNENALSASFVRNIVKCGNFDKFRELYLPYIDEERITHLYKQIQEGLNLTTQTTKSGGKKTKRMSKQINKRNKITKRRNKSKNTKKR